MITRTRIATQRSIRAQWSEIVTRAVRGGHIGESYRDTALEALPLHPSGIRILSSSVKTEKGEKGEEPVLTAVAYLCPATEAGGRKSTCAWSTPECEFWCLVASGLLGKRPSGRARLWRTALRFGAPELYFELLAHEIRAHAKKARKIGAIPAVRLDGTTDLGDAQRPDMRALFAETGVQAYDYSKSLMRVMASLVRGQRSALLHDLAHVPVTFSYSGPDSDYDSDRVLEAGGNVAVVLDIGPDDPKPEIFRGRPAIDGDVDDARFRDPSGCWVILSAKGNALRRFLREGGRSPFVVSSHQTA